MKDAFWNSQKSTRLLDFIYLFIYLLACSTLSKLEPQVRDLSTLATLPPADPSAPHRCHRAWQWGDSHVLSLTLASVLLGTKFMLFFLQTSPTGTNRCAFAGRHTRFLCCELPLATTLPDKPPCCPLRPHPMLFHCVPPEVALEPCKATEALVGSCGETSRSARSAGSGEEVFLARQAGERALVQRGVSCHAWGTGAWLDSLSRSPGLSVANIGCLRAGRQWVIEPLSLELELTASVPYRAFRWLLRQRELALFPPSACCFNPPRSRSFWSCVFHLYLRTLLHATTTPRRVMYCYQWTGSGGAVLCRCFPL